MVYTTDFGKKLEYMKRYLLFSYDQYYPEGGMNDFRESYATLDEAIFAQNNFADLNGRRYDIYDIYDTLTMSLVE